jgi:hypothetical protein
MLKVAIRRSITPSARIGTGGGETVTAGFFRQAAQHNASASATVILPNFIRGNFHEFSEVSNWVGRTAARMERRLLNRAPWMSPAFSVLSEAIKGHGAS